MDDTTDEDGGDEMADDTGEPPPSLCEPAVYPLDFPMGGAFDVARENDGMRLIGMPGDTLQVASSPLWEDACPNYGLGPGGINFNEETNFWVYRPSDPGSPDPNGWPAVQVGQGVVPTPLPVAFFIHSRGGAIVQPGSDDDCPHLYGHILDELAAAGFLVVAVSGAEFAEDKQRSLWCALDWLYTVSPYAAHASCDVSFLGHSAGGGAAQAMVSAVQEQVPDLTVRAAVGIAPVVADDPTSAEHAVPYLLLQSPSDDDATTHAGVVYDRIAPEDPAPMPFSPADKVLLWPYGTVDHHAWGGEPIGDPPWTDCEDPEPTPAELPASAARIRAIASFYVPTFLRWAVYGEDEHRHWFVDPTLYDAGVEAFPDEIAGPAVLEDWWSELYENSNYAVLGERPVMLAAFSQGASGPPDRRLRVDTMWRDGSPASCNDPGHLTALVQGTTVQNASNPGDTAGVATEPLGMFATGDVCIGFDGWTAGGFGEVSGSAETERMTLAWEEATDADAIGWLFGARDLAPYATLGVRAQRFGSPDPASMRITVETECAADPAACNGPGGVALAHLDYDRLIRAGGARNLRNSVRFPMLDFCEQEIDLSQTRAIYVSGTDDEQPSGASISLDSLELTDHPLDADLRCSAPSAWRCEATTTLVATETSCDGEPTSSACDSLDVVTAPVDLPHVDVGAGWDGWAVWAPPGWVVDPQDPTQEEIDRVLARCVTACMQEYSGSAHVAANCDATGAFETPEPVTIPGAMGTRLSIPDAYRDGSGVEEGESLACDVLGSCCAELDEDVCPAAPRRVTVAQTQLGRGEEHVAAVAGTLTVLSPDDSTQAEADVVGTVGWSACPESESQPTVHCPFYLGSAHLETTEPLTLDLFCDGQWVERDLDALEVDLSQPAFGIDLETGAWKGFPPGALVLTAAVEAGLVSLQTTETNAEPVEVEAYPGYIEAMPAPPGGFKVEFRIWCDGEIKPIEAYFGFEATEALHGPPTLGIEHLPDTIECPDELALTLAWGTDPEEDYASLRWVVDGVLLDDSLSTIPFTESHEVTAILRDVRGATGSATKSIACE